LKPVLALTALKALTLVGAGHIAMRSIFTPGFSTQMSTCRNMPWPRYPCADSAVAESANGGASPSTWPLAGLTYLHISPPSPPNSRTTPDVAKLTSLKHLIVSTGTSFGPGLLQTLTQLEALVIDSCPIEMLSPHGWDRCPSRQAVQTFLHALANLQQLRRLELVGHCFPDSRFDPTFRDGTGYAAAADYSALTASSKLEVLKLPAADMPPGAWGHAFESGAGRNLPHLTELVVEPSTEGQDPDKIKEPVLKDIVRCCPNLRKLELVNDVMGRHEHLAPLLQLTALARFGVCYATRSFRETIPEILITNQVSCCSLCLSVEEGAWGMGQGSAVLHCKRWQAAAAPTGTTSGHRS
jgi:hypothetical protein